VAINRRKVQAKADKLVGAGKLKDAAKEFLKLMDDDPKDPITSNSLGDVYRKLGQMNLAVERYLHTAKLYATDGFAVKAIATLRKILSRCQEDNLEALEMLAELQRDQGFVADAKQALKSLVELLPKAGKFEKACQCCKDLVDLDPNNLQIRLKYGEMLLRSNNRDQGIQQLLVVGRKLTQQGMAKEATRVFQRALDLAPDNMQILQGVVRTQVASEEGEAAVALLNSVLSKHPEKMDVRLLLAESHIEMEEFGKAAEVLKVALSQDPKDLLLFQRFQNLLLRQGEIDQAWESTRERLDTLLESNQIPEAEALVDEILKFENHYSPALIFQAHLSDQSGNVTRQSSLYGNLVDILVENKEWKEAKAAIQRLIELEPEAEVLKQRQSYILEQLGEGNPKEKEKKFSEEGEGETSQPETLSSSDVSSVESEDILVELPTEEIEEDLEEVSIDTSVTEGDDLKPDGPQVKDEIEDLKVEAEFTQENLEEISASNIEEVEPEKEASKAVKPDPQMKSKAPPPEMGELVTEAEVFLKYGLTERAIQQLKAAIKMDANYIPAHRRLIEIYRGQGVTKKLVRSMVSLAEVYLANEELAIYRELIEEAKGVDPTHRSLKGHPVGDLDASIEIDLDASGDLEIALMEVEDLSPDASSVNKKVEFIEEKVEEEDGEEAELNISTNENEILEVEPQDSVSLEQQEDSSADEIEILEDEEVEEMEEEAPQVEESENAEIQEEEISSSLTLSEEELDEAESAVSEDLVTPKIEEAMFYVHQGLVVEAERILSQLQEIAPKDSRVLDLEEDVADCRSAAKEKEEVPSEESEVSSSFLDMSGLVPEDLRGEGVVVHEEAESKPASLPDMEGESEVFVDLAAEISAALEGENLRWG